MPQNHTFTAPIQNAGGGGVLNSAIMSQEKGRTQ